MSSFFFKQLGVVIIGKIKDGVPWFSVLDESQISIVTYYRQCYASLRFWMHILLLSDNLFCCNCNIKDSVLDSVSQDSGRRVS